MLSIKPAVTTFEGTALQGFSNPTSSQREVVFRVTDYLDSTGDTNFGYQQYLFDLGWNPLVSTGLSGSKNVSRVLEFHLYALPQFALETDSSAVIVAFTLPTAQGQATCQQTTLLTPTSVSDWVSVGHWKEQTVFSTSEVTPAFVDPVDDAEPSLMALGTFAVLDPDTLNLSGHKIQYRVELKVAVTMPIVSYVQASVPSSNEPDAWWTWVDTTSGQTNALVEPAYLRSRD